MLKKGLLLLAVSLATLTACDDKAQIASRNLSKAADNFELNRRVVFFNGITDKYLLSIEGRCSINVDSGKGKLDVTCLVAPGKYKKHSLGLSDNVSYFSEQLEVADVSVYHYRVTFKPQQIIPDIRFDGDAEALDKAVTVGGEGQ